MNKINSKKYNNSKKAQFYIISSIIIILVITTLASVTNYVYIKPEPEKFYDLADILSLEGKYVIDNANYKSGDINSQIQTYLSLYANYLAKNTEADFNLIILYGDITSGNITGSIYSRASLGDVNINLGSTNFNVIGGTTISQSDVDITIGTITGEENKVNLTIISENPPLSITQVVPILEDNNFIFIMSTNDGFNQYVRTNLNPPA